MISINKEQAFSLETILLTSTKLETSSGKKFAILLNSSIFVRADEDVPFGAFATVMDAVKQSGIAKRQHRHPTTRKSWQPTLKSSLNTIAGAAI